MDVDRTTQQSGRCARAHRHYPIPYRGYRIPPTPSANASARARKSKLQLKKQKKSPAPKQQGQSTPYRDLTRGGTRTIRKAAAAACTRTRTHARTHARLRRRPTDGRNCKPRPNIDKAKLEPGFSPVSFRHRNSLTLKGSYLGVTDLLCRQPHRPASSIPSTVQCASRDAWDGKQETSNGPAMCTTQLHAPAATCRTTTNRGASGELATYRITSPMCGLASADIRRRWRDLLWRNP